MRLDLILFFLTLLLAFTAGNITYFLRSTKIANVKDIKFIERVIKEVQEERSPVIRIDLNSSYPTLKHLTLLEGRSPILSNIDPFPLSTFECMIAKNFNFSQHTKRKEHVWLTYFCGELKSLDPIFYELPPFIHINGLSYAYMQYQLIKDRKTKRNWLRTHSHLMHIDELRKIARPTSRQQNLLLSLYRTSIAKILEGDQLILNGKYFLIKTGNLQFTVLASKYIKRAFERAGFTLEYSQNKCFYKHNDLCWKKKPQTFISFLSQTSIILFIISLFVIIMSARILITRIKRKKLEDERKKHALRVITHELRTPVASLLLQLNTLTSNSNQYSEKHMEDILRIERDVYRLKHLAEKSKGYLQTDDDKLLNLAPIHIESVVEFCEQLILEFENTEIILDKKFDTSINVDTYWFKLCLSNLIENAIRYGVSPIRLSIEVEKKSLKLSIIDQGDLKETNLKALLRSKNQSSKGLGIGLNIVYKSLKAMGGNLTLSSKPTQFTICLPLNLDREAEDQNV